MFSVDPFSELYADIRAYEVSIPESEWSHLLSISEIRTAKKNEVIFSETELCRHVIYLMNGITATVYLHDGKEVVTRFFQKGNFNTNIVSAESKSIASDFLLAVTDVQFLLFPFDFFLDSFFYSNTFGLFVRKKLMKMIIENKKNTTIKTINDTKVKYQFLIDNYPDILERSPSKYIAKFMGLTPEGYSRFLSTSGQSSKLLSKA
ncbi:MAG: cyclic nucleotide-binding domain-containing protein [Bacteroidota bacterium]